MIRRPPRSTQSRSSAASDVYKRQQLHNIMRDEQLDQIFGKDGAIEAMQKARSEKMVRFLGITGHYDPAVLMKGIERFDFDTILMALNPADKHHLPFVSTILPLANKKGMGVIGMKIPARDRIFKPDGITSIKGCLLYTSDAADDLLC